MGQSMNASRFHENRRQDGIERESKVGALYNVEDIALPHKHKGSCKSLAQ